jgi:hypothetical protein
MGFFDWLNSETAEQRYQAAMSEVFPPLRKQLEDLPDQALIPLFSSIGDAAEKTFRRVLFQGPPSVNLKKHITTFEAQTWLRKTSVAMMGYGSQFDDSYSPLLGLSSQLFWENALVVHNRQFKVKLELDQIQVYSAGLAEDNRNQYSRKGETAPVFALTWNDNLRIGCELLQSIWNRELKGKIPPPNPDEVRKRSDLREALFIGSSVWQGYTQIVHPVLEALFHKSRQTGI